jgi:hypothetical protein
VHELQEAFAQRQQVVLSQLGSLVDFHAALLGEFFDVKAILFYTVRARWARAAALLAFRQSAASQLARPLAVRQSARESVAQPHLPVTQPAPPH